MILSVVTTLYRSAPYIGEFHARASAAARSLIGERYEIVMVNDGSPDNSLELAVGLASCDPHVKVVDLSRNFGHHKALMTGLRHSSGEFVFLIDSDLEEQPESLERFAEEMRTARCDVVFGVQEARKGSWFERASGKVFYSLHGWLTGMPLPRNLITLRLMTRRYVDALLEHEERDMVIACLWQLTGFEQRPLPIRKQNTSPTTYSLRQKVSLLVGSVTAVSSRPLSAVFYFGVGVFLLSAIYVTWLVLLWVFFARPPEGWTSLIASVWLLGGGTISSIGAVGIYLAKVFIEVKHRPYSIVRSIHGSGATPTPDYDRLMGPTGGNEIETDHNERAAAWLNPL